MYVCMHVHIRSVLFLFLSSNLEIQCVDDDAGDDVVVKRLGSGSQFPKVLKSNTNYKSLRRR